MRKGVKGLITNEYKSYYINKYIILYILFFL